MGKKWFLFIAVFLLNLLVSAPFANAGSLSCQMAASCSGGITVFKISSATNGHAELPSQSNYTQLVCCSGVSGLGNSCSGNFAVVANLSGATNAHIEQNNQSNYANNACLSVPSGAAVSVGYQADSCSGFDTTLASMSSSANAHAGDANAFSVKICATASDAQTATSPPAPLGGGSPGAFSGAGPAGASVPTPVQQTILPDGTIVINPPVITPPATEPITEAIQSITESITEAITSQPSGQAPSAPLAPSAVEGTLPFPPLPPSISFSQPSSLFQNIITEAKASFNQTKETVQAAYQEVKKAANTPTGKVTTSTAVVVPVAVAVGQGIAGTLLPNVSSFADLYSILVRMLGLLGEALGIKKRARKWGIVYDSKTKRPIDPAYVKIINEDGKIVSERFTDMEGRFGFLVPPGRYRLEVSKTHYSFPSTLNTRRDELYDNLYYGEMLYIPDSSIVNFNIPMDPVDIDWNEEIKKKIMTFNPQNEILKKRITQTLFLFGFILSPLVYWITPSPFNLAVIFFYFLVLTLGQFGFKAKTFGRIYDKTTGRPIPFAKIKVSFADTPDQVIATAVSDITGRYYILVAARGNYLLEVEGKLIEAEAPEKVINRDISI